MTTVKELLQRHDPLRHEPQRSDDRVRVRQALTATAGGDAARRTRRPPLIVAATIAAAVLIAATAGSRLWTADTTLHAATVRFEARLAESAPGPDLIPAHVAGSSQTIYLHQETVVTNEDVANARVVPGAASSEFQVAIVFTPEGAHKMLAATEAHLGQPLALLIDGEVVMAPTIRSAVSSQAMLSGRYTWTEADRIATGMIAR